MKMESSPYNAQTRCDKSKIKSADNTARS